MSIFSTDHERDLASPEYREAFLRESTRIAAADIFFNDLADRVLTSTQEALADQALAERRAQALRDIDLLYTAAGTRAQYDYDSIPIMSEYEFDALVRITGRSEDEIHAAVNLSATEGAPTIWEILDLSGEQVTQVLHAWMLGIGAVVLTSEEWE